MFVINDWLILKNISNALDRLVHVYEVDVPSLILSSTTQRNGCMFLVETVFSSSWRLKFLLGEKEKLLRKNKELSSQVTVAQNTTNVLQ